MSIDRPGAPGSDDPEDLTRAAIARRLPPGAEHWDPQRTIPPSQPALASEATVPPRREATPVAAGAESSETRPPHPARRAEPLPDPELERTLVAMRGLQDKMRPVERRPGGAADAKRRQRPTRRALMQWVTAALSIAVGATLLFFVVPQVSSRWRARTADSAELASPTAPGGAGAPQQTAPDPATDVGTAVAQVSPESEVASPESTPDTPVVSEAPASETGADSNPQVDDAAAAAATEATTPAVTMIPTAEVGDAEYAVHVSSYRAEAQAAVEIERLRQRGFEARAVPTDLGSKGVWYRVFVGTYATADEARATRAALAATPAYAEARVRRVPRVELSAR